MLNLKKRLSHVYAKFNPNIVNNGVTKQIIDYYNGDSGHQTNRVSGDLGFGYIHYALIKNCKPDHVLCVVSRKGYIPAICALACKDNKKGHVDFVDAGYDQDDKNHWSGIGWWKKIKPEEHYSFLGVNTWLTSYITTTLDYEKLHPKKKYQYIYIDGDHSYEGIKLDYTLFWPKLTKYGFMVWHDVAVKYTKDLGSFGVWKFWNELKTKQKILFPYPKESGLGIIQKI